MTSNAKTMLQGLISLVVVSWASGAYAQNLETPGAPAAEAAAAPAAAGPSGFGDGGQLVLSIENQFGYNWRHENNNGRTSSTNTFTLLGNPYGAGAYPYDWPRLGVDYFVIQSISVGTGLAFARTSGDNSSTNAVEVAPRVGYGMMVGPWLAVWPRLGVSYIWSTNQSYLGLTIDLQAVAVLAQHFALTFAPVVNIPLTGKSGGVSDKFTTIGIELGLAIPF
jgi:hypothetical protein